ncbi:hypothetical protein HHK36_016800 [Tetracentron sinense]|uniref:Wall-associated receptor kinase C-terminal domain-containing protein n=1 Tax=Tetracentron sinense TaxID=13715 RepID=A0A834Z1Z4_TETSI|nr:hypothetical protein HHK36_016800 [Tetracentron sinense]
MQPIKKTILLYFLILNLTFCSPSTAQPTSTRFCGKMKIQTPFSLKNSSQDTPLNRMLLCKSQKLYFRTSLGLFSVSSIDYRAKTLTISHPSCSSSLHFVSPSLLSAGFPSPPQPNSLLLFNCLSQRNLISPILHNCTHFNGCSALSVTQEKDQAPSSCLLVDDSDKLEMSFDPKALNCSHYSRVYWDSSSLDEGVELGTRISFDIPDHIPNVCDECNKAQGNCGVGLRCICHPKECKDKVYSRGISMDPVGNTLFSFLFCIVIVVSFMGC